MTTPIEHLQSTLKGLGLTAVEARLENLLEQAAKNDNATASQQDDDAAAQRVTARRHGGALPQ